MKSGYLAIIGLLIIMLLIAGCSGPSTTTTTTSSGTGYGITHPAKGMTASMTARPTTPNAGTISFYDKTKFTWYELLETTTGDHWKYDYTTGTFHGQPAIVKRATRIYKKIPVTQISEVYTDSNGTVLGSVIKNILNGKESVEESSGNIYSFEYDMLLPRNELTSEGTETITVHAGTFLCDKYYGKLNGKRYFVSSEVPLPVRQDTLTGTGTYSLELWAWG